MVFFCRIDSTWDTLSIHPPSLRPTQPTLPLSVSFPAVTHVLFFKNAREMTSRRCVPGRVDSAKNQHGYYFVFIWMGQAAVIIVYFFQLLGGKGGKAHI